MSEDQVRAALILVNFDDTFVPTEVTAEMITQAIRPAIKPYSIAVAPDWSSIKRRSKSLMGIGSITLL